ncbi:MAG: MltA-interacting MipA family protein [Gammaproteobacteria bacterium]|nr:MltA-interacting MipA family protein [Gammaproteobacteria bacterium]
MRPPEAVTSKFVNGTQTMNLRRMVLGLFLPLALLTNSMRSAAAEDSTAADAAQSTTADENDNSSARDPFEDKWKFQVGAGVINAARYPGSRYDFTRGLPLISISYDRYFIGGVPGSGAPAGIGAYLLHTEHWAVGLDVGGDARKPRRASDDPVLRGWGDIPGTARGGMFASYNIDWLSVRGSVSVGGHNEGVLASLGVEAKYHATQRLTLTIGPELTWVNNQYAMTFFGIDAAQSEIAGIAPYRARSGIDFLGGSAGASYILTDHWSLAAHVSYGRLQGDAADSPVTTDKTQRVYGAFVMYRF